MRQGPLPARLCAAARGPVGLRAGEASKTPSFSNTLCPCALRRDGEVYTESNSEISCGLRLTAPRL